MGPEYLDDFGLKGLSNSERNLGAILQIVLRVLQSLDLLKVDAALVLSKLVRRLLCLGLKSSTLSLESEVEEDPRFP